MKISYNWLKEYIDIPEKAEDIASILTSTGLEVEYIESFETIKGGLEGVVIGKVLTCTKHPNADKLSITTVDVGSKIHTIVCGAPNVAAGQKVMVALPGCTLYPKNGDPFTIKSTKIRGEQSDGMICAEDEIGIGKGHEGIIVLPENVPVGTPASEYYKIESDHVLEIGLTPNRADAASHIGVARDIKAACKRELRWPSVDHFKIDNTTLPIDVLVENQKACQRYSGITLSNIHVTDSPAWLKNKLLSIGLTPINNVVDVTNFICHELGQPMHAFDADKITGKKIIVKTAQKGDRFVTLDGNERLLQENDLMICNTGEAMCIAGVFGGRKSGVTTNTKNIFLESACFAADYVRKSSLHHGLKTDASFRFERGTDPNITIYALKRAALLIKEIAGGNISSEIIDVYPSKIENRSILIKDKNVNRLIGKVLPRNKVVDILQRLDINIQQSEPDKYTVSIPPYRVDVTQEADVVEEILRIYGFNNIEVAQYANTNFISSFPQKNPNQFRNTLSQQLSAIGFYEIWTNSLTNEEYLKKNNLLFDEEPIHILNKLSEEQGVLRQTLLFSGLEICSYNINRKQKDLKFYEFGKVYSKKNNSYKESERLALFLTGNIEAENWKSKTQQTGFHDIAQAVHTILQKCAVANPIFAETKDPIFDFAVTCSSQNREYVRFGKVKNSILNNMGIKQEVFYADFDFDLLFRSSSPKLVLKEVPKFPEVRRDLSLIIDKNITFAMAKSLAIKIENSLIKSINLFDIYEGDKLPEGKKTYTLSFILQDEQKTLTDTETDRLMNKLIKAYQEELGAIIRK